MHIAAAAVASLVWLISLAFLAASGMTVGDKDVTPPQAQITMIGLGAMANLIAIALICYAVA